MEQPVKDLETLRRELDDLRELRDRARAEQGRQQPSPEHLDAEQKNIQPLRGEG